jgi:hypothetical protein
MLGGMEDGNRTVVELRKQDASSYHVKLTLREALRAWRHGLSLPAGRVQAEYGFTVQGGGGGEYGGKWDVPPGVTSVQIEVTGSAQPGT